METGLIIGFAILAIPVIGVTPQRLGMENWPGWFQAYCAVLSYLGAWQLGRPQL